MKKLIMLLTLLIGSFQLLAQSQTDSIKQDVKTYFGLLQEEKISEALDWVHPDLIGMIGKEMFLTQYEEMLKKASFGAMEINSISNTYQTEDNGSYALVSYTFKMNYNLEEMDEQVKEVFLNRMKSSYGEENAKRLDDTVLVQADREMFAVSMEKYKGWRILDYEKGMKMLLQSIIPREVLTHFGK